MTHRLIDQEGDATTIARGMHMRHSAETHYEAWAITDVYGEIQSASREARHMLGLKDGGRHNLLLAFPDSCKALVFDIEVALTGWPTGRTVALRKPGACTAAVRYRVSRRLDSERLELFWQLHCDTVDDLPRCA